ncbi:MAG: hypothetical protein JRI79_13505 [Deltaproteobacteria bacterium]|mgnify:CR=1 FL=1|nr:hypothetical protein [Deltaproteobacteria bacterium]MBW1978961.1 hypothetical protein [Deltaproteobacteria bacterium]MBW2044465.1 hypothetical protein [Deltaproteobacteria bacterium]
MRQTIDLKKLFDELKRIKKSMITHDDMNRFIETLDLLLNPSSMEQIYASERDIELGNIKEINSVSDL